MTLEPIPSIRIHALGPVLGSHPEFTPPSYVIATPRPNLSNAMPLTFNHRPDEHALNQPDRHAVLLDSKIIANSSQPQKPPVLGHFLLPDAWGPDGSSLRLLKTSNQHPALPFCTSQRSLKITWPIIQCLLVRGRFRRQPPPACN